MAQVRKIAGIASLSVAGGLIALWLGVGLWAMWLGPAWFSAQLKERARVDAAIGSLRTDFLSSLTFRDVIVSAPVRGRVDELRFSFRPWDLFSLKSRDRHIFKLDIVRPDFELPKGPFSTGSPKSGPIRIIPMRAVVHDGRVKVNARGREWELDGVNGAVTVLPFRIDAEADGRVSGYGPLRARLKAGLTAPRNWELRVAGDALDLSAVMDLAPPAVDKFGSGTGMVAADVALKGTRVDAIHVDDWRGSVKTDDVVWQVRPGARPIRLAGGAELTPRYLRVAGLRVGNGLTIDGEAKHPFAEPALDFKLKAENASVEELASYWREKPLSVAGRVSGDVALTGTAKAPTVAGTYRFSGSAGRLLLPPAEGSFAFEGGHLDSTTTFAGGQLIVSGAGVDGLGPVWSVQAKNVALEEIAGANGWRNVSGTVGARFLVRGSPAVVNGRVETSPIQWGRLKFARTTGASVRLTKDEIIVRADNGALSATAFREKSKIQIESLKLALSGAGNVSASGRVDVDTREVDLQTELDGLSPDLWPPLVERYPEISGALSAKGRIQGNLSNLGAAFDLAWKDLKFYPSGDGYDGEGRLSVDSETIKLSNATGSGGYSGGAAWSRADKRWEADLRLDEASPRFLRDIARSSANVTGALTGQLHASGPPMALVSSFTWSGGAYGDFTFDQFAAGAVWEGNAIQLRDASLIKGAQAVRGQANFVKRGERWAVDTLAQIQGWGPSFARVDGEIQAEGTFEPARRALDLVVTAPVLWLADRSLENFKATIDGSAGRWNVKASAGDQVDLRASLDGASGRLAGRLKTRGLRLEALFPVDRPTEGRDAPPRGAYDLDATLSGTLSEPAASIRVALNDAEWRLETFSGEAMVSVKRSSVVIESAKLALGAGGEVLARGSVGLGKGGTIRIEGAGTDVNLQSVFHLLWWPVRWDGKAETAFVIARDAGGFNAQIRFDGDHEGFGPFKEGGEFRGEVIGRGREWDLSNIYVESGDGYARLKDGSKIFLDKSGAGTMRAVADLRNLQLGPIALFGGLEAAGRWGGERAGEAGRRIDVDLFARSLWLNQFVLDGNVTHMAIENKAVVFSAIPGSGQQISGAVRYDAFPDLVVNDVRYFEGGREKLFLAGNVGTPKWDYLLRARGLDAAIVRGLLDTDIAMSGPVDVDALGKGSPSKPDISADVRWTAGRIGPVPLDDGRGKFVYKEGEVRLGDVVIEKKDGYQLTGSGRFGVGEAKDTVPMEINLRIERGNLELLEEMTPEVTKARGSFDGRLRIGGGAGRATISGFLNAQKMSVRSSYTPDLDRGELRLRFDKNRLLVDRAVARLGRGEVVGGGFVEFQNGLPSFYELSLKSAGSDGASIRVPQLAIAPGPVLGRFSLLKKKLAGVSRGEPIVDLEFTGPADSPTLAGTVLLENSVFTYPPSGKDGGSGSSWLRRFLARMNWDVTLNAGRRTWFQNELVDASVSGALDFRGQTNDLDVNGKIRSDQGSIVYSGNEFRIKEAELEIETRRPFITRVDRKTTIVYLRAVAEKEVFYTDGLANSNQDVIVMVVDRAPIGEIQPRFYAKNNPNLSSQRALQLALGLPFGDAIDNNSLLPDQRARASDQADTDKMLRLGLVQLLDSSLASPLARAIARTTGLVDFIRVTYQENDPHEPDGAADFEDRSGATDVTDNEFLRYAKGTKVRFGRGLGRRLFADYSFRVDEFESQVNLRHELELAYRLHRNLFLRGTSELDRERELGRPPDRRAILENQWRFGLPRRKPATVPAPAEPAGPVKPDAG